MNAAASVLALIDRVDRQNAVRALLVRVADTVAGRMTCPWGRWTAYLAAGLAFDRIYEVDRGAINASVASGNIPY